MPDSYAAVNGRPAYSCYTDEVQHLGARLRQLRIKRGLKQEELAERLDVDQSTVSNVERGKTGTGISTLIQWVDECGGSLEIRMPADEADVREQAVEAVSRAEVADLVYLLDVLKALPDANARDRRLALKLLQPEPEAAPTTPAAQPSRARG